MQERDAAKDAGCIEWVGTNPVRETQIGYKTAVVWNGVDVLRIWKDMVPACCLEY